MLVMNGEFGKRLADTDRFSVCATQRQGTQDKKAAADEVAKGHGWGSRFDSEGGHRRLFKSVWRVHGQVAKSAHSGASTSSIQCLCQVAPRLGKTFGRWAASVKASLVCVTFKQACMQVSFRAAEVLRVSLAQAVFRAELFKQGGLPNPNAHQAADLSAAGQRV